ncbi:acyltransferase [Georgenia sp. Marseille-Q6866]
MSTSLVQFIRYLTTRAVLSRWVASARLRGIRLVVKAHPTARVEPGVILEIFAGSSKQVRVELGPQVRLESGALVRLTGGAELVLGPTSVVRRFSVLNVSGRLLMEGHNLLSWHSVVHCAEEVVFEPRAGTGEGVTVVDGRHFRHDPEDHWYHNSVCSPIRIEANAWLASHSTVGPGVVVGRAATVAAGSVVLGDVPADTLVAGAPARVIRTSINTPEDRVRRRPAREGQTET